MRESMFHENRELDDILGEYWDLHPTYDLIKASNYGRIKRLAFTKQIRIKGKTCSYTSHDKILKQSWCMNSLRVSFKWEGKCKGVKVHRIVWEALYGEVLTPSWVVVHLDKNKANNHIDNLVAVPRNVYFGIKDMDLTKLPRITFEES